MPYPNRNCETESLLMRLVEKHAEVSETILQPYGLRHFECLGFVGGVLNMGRSLFCWGATLPVSKTPVLPVS